MARANRGRFESDVFGVKNSDRHNDAIAKNGNCGQKLRSTGMAFERLNNL